MPQRSNDSDDALPLADLHHHYPFHHSTSLNCKTSLLSLPRTWHVLSRIAYYYRTADLWASFLIWILTSQVKSQRTNLVGACEMGRCIGCAKFKKISPLFTGMIKHGPKQMRLAITYSNLIAWLTITESRLSRVAIWQTLPSYESVSQDIIEHCLLSTIKWVDDITGVTGTFFFTLYYSSIMSQSVFDHHEYKYWL